MPRFWRRKSRTDEAQSSWFIKIKNTTPPPPAHTFQIKPAGIRILKQMGLESGDSFPAKQFWILYDLGLIYTLTDTNDNRSNVDEFLSGDSRDKAEIHQLSHKQLVTFVQEILNEQEVSNIDESKFYQMLRSISKGPEESRSKLIEIIIEDTPVSLGALDGLVDGGVYQSSIFGALVCRAFHNYLSSYVGELSGDFDILGHKTDYSYLLLNQSEWDEISLLQNFSVDLPQSYLNKVLSNSSDQNWERPILETLHESMFIPDSAGNRVGTVIFDGIKSAKNNESSQFYSAKAIIIVPRSVLSTKETVDIV